MHFFNYLLVFSAYLYGNLEAATSSRKKIKNRVEGWENASSNESSLIPLVNLGGKSYYFGIYFTATYLEADQFCRDINMDLVRVQTSEENDKLYKYVQEQTKQDHFWTAGSKLLDKKNWIWMTTGEIIDYTNWGSGQPDNPNTELCLELWLFKGKGLYFNDRDCNVKFPFICEKNKHQQNGSSHGSNSNWPAVFQNPSVSPNINLLHFEGKSYYFGTNFKATYLQAFQFCEIINMKLVSITSDAENSRIHKYLRDTGVVDSFWSSGSKAIDGKTWVWLSYGIKVEYTHWLSGQPDNVNEQCLELVQKKEEGLLWNDLTCTNLLYFICERNDRIIPLLPPLGPGPVTQPTAPVASHTTTVEVHPTAQYPENPSLPITVVGGKPYRVSQISASQGNASQICEQYGMELVSIEDKKKNDIVTNLIKQSGKSGAEDNYWTSANKQSDGKWVWWDNQLVTYTNWAKGEPNNADKREFCLELYPDGQWNDLACEREFYFICESPFKENSHHCASQPVINVYVNNNQCSNAKNATVTEVKKVATSKDGEGYNVEINNNIETCPKAVPHK
ncbi:macrophage mannose receptor 1-like [Anoplophora glabripennis]|uniref:macrophage mannose receptor 1-like n=1 Tax=Anoplophora glabripennis TaxID=217634 RepID=UPI00087474DD|nr:macrophage mannose receptor 1-like [Anoplophora glabripennis]